MSVALESVHEHCGEPENVCYLFIRVWSEVALAIPGLDPDLGPRPSPNADNSGRVSALGRLASQGGTEQPLNHEAAEFHKLESKRVYLLLESSPAVRAWGTEGGRGMCWGLGAACGKADLLHEGWIWQKLGNVFVSV